MATYYVRADGTAANKGAATSASSASTSLSIAGYNAETFSAGDIIIISDAGGVYRAEMNPPSSGTAENHIVHEADGYPVINGSDLITGWSDQGGNIWTASYGTQPQQVFIDDGFGDRQSTNDLSADGEWYWESNTLYLYLSTSPNSSVIEGGARGSGIYANGRSGLTYRGIEIKKASGSGFRTNDVSHLLLDQMEIEWSWTFGFLSGGSYDYSDHIIRDCSVHHTGGTGISYVANSVGTTVSDILVQRNTLTKCGQYQGMWVGDHGWAGGIKFFGATGGAAYENTIAEKNLIYDTGSPDHGGGVGVWFDFCMNDGTHPNKIRHNHIYNNYSCGTFMEVSDYVHVYDNLIRGNGIYNNEGWWYSASVRIDTRVSEPVSNCQTSNHNRVYNNTVIGGPYSLHGFMGLVINPGTGVELVDNIVKNNIFTGHQNSEMQMLRGADNNPTYGHDNVYQYNAIEEKDECIWWNEVKYDSIAAWEAASWVVTDSGTTHSVAITDSPFEDASTGKYWLASGSPCAGAGASLPADFSDGLLAETVWPDGVVLGDRNDY